MTKHILNRPAPPAMPKRPEPPKPSADQISAQKELRRTKAAEAVHRAIEGSRKR